MHKSLLFLIALFWTGIVSYLCLIDSSQVPAINIPNLDKFVHAFFHSVFTLVWFLFFYKQLKSRSIFKPLLIAFLLSILFGISIEVLQKLYTTTRKADVLDVLANFIGAIAAVFIVINCNKRSVFKIILRE